MPRLPQFSASSLVTKKVVSSVTGRALNTVQVNCASEIATCVWTVAALPFSEEGT